MTAYAKELERHSSLGYSRLGIEPSGYTQITITHESLLIQEQPSEISTNKELKPVFEKRYHKF
ncbi:hypothetical protein BgiBS90_037429, partial [Biomphalaria glabrata]